MAKKSKAKVAAETDQIDGTQAKQLDQFKGEEQTREAPEPKYNWMNQTRSWGTRVLPSDRGITLGSLNVGVYGEVPTTWEDRTRNPRGAIPVPETPPVTISVRNKVDLWSDNAADLYEEAIQRRWAPATDIPWHTLAPLPDDIEHALCQIYTEFTQSASVDVEVITSWQHQMAYGYHEVKQYLATASFDAGRRLEAFRKRALANGGGLGIESPGQTNRFLLENSAGWSEAVVGLVFHRGLFQMTMLRYLERFALSEADRMLARYTLQDLSRIVAYGIGHLKFALANAPMRMSSLGTSLLVGDLFLSRDLADSAMREAFAIVFGAGVQGAKKQGMRTYYDMLDSYVRDHLALTKYLGFMRPLQTMPRVFDPARRFESSSP